MLFRSSGKAEVCKTFIPSSILGVASTFCRGGGTGRRKGLKIPGPQGCAGSIPALGTKTKRTGTIQIHTRLPFKISPFTLVVAIANANRRGFFFFPPSFLSPPPSAPQPLRTRRHVFLHTLWAGSAYFPWGVGGASRASGGHPGSLSISAG